MLSLAALFWGFLLPLAAQQSFTEQLTKNRYELKVEGGRMAGTGVAVLEAAIQDAQFVLVGEDHGIAEIPAVYAGLCDIAGPLGFHTMAIETGPLVAAELQQWVRQANGKAEAEQPRSIRADIAECPRNRPKAAAWSPAKQAIMAASPRKAAG